MVVPAGFTTFAERRAQGLFQDPTGAFSQSATTSIGKSPSSSSSVFGSGTAGSSSSSKILTFPFDVGDGSSNNHFITFQIREFKPAKVSAARKLLKEAQANLAEISEQLEDEEDIDTIGSFIEPATQAVANAEAVVAREQANVKGVGRPVSGTSIALKDSQKSKLKQTIALYMPPSVNTSYSVSYADQEIGALAHIGITALDAFFAGQGAPTADRLKNVSDEVRGPLKDRLQKATLGMLDAIAPGARALQQARTGTVITPRMELMFERVNRRSFSYNFVMIPKSEAEAKMIEQIVQAFKMGMHPEFVDATKSFRRVKMPDLFEITYHSHGGENSFINKISTCYLKSVNVTYGGDRYTAHEPTTGINGRGSPPQRTTIALEFSELGILSKEDIQTGF